MNGNDTFPNGLQSCSMSYSVEIETVQFTNNLDGILRDSKGNPIPLRPRDFQHQICFGHEMLYLGTNWYDNGNGEPTKYIFKNGKIEKVAATED